MVKIHKLSKKHNVSEFLNSNKTKKHEKLDIKNYKKNIQKLIEKQNKKKREYIPDKTDKTDKSIVLHKQLGGATKTAPEFAKYQYGKFSLFNTSKASRKAKPLDVKKFDIFTKDQYFWLKRNIYNTIRGSWLLLKFGKITEEEHELLKRLLKAHMYFARIKLVMGKLYKIIVDLYGTHDSIIRKLQRKIRKVFDLQMDIEYAYKNPNEAHSRESSSFSEKIKKFFNKRKWTKKLYEKFIKKTIKTQDELRKEIMEQTIFYSTKDLGSGCNNLGILSKIGKKFRKSKKLICSIGRYRKYEFKFNKFYYLFREQYKKFIRAYPACDGTADTNVFAAYLNIDEESQNTAKDYYAFDKTKCDSYELKKATDIILDEAGGLIKTQIGDTVDKTRKDQKEIDESFKRKGVDLNNLMTQFTKYIDVFKRLFQNGEAYGIRHHHGLPKKKGLLNKLFGESQKSKRLLAKPGTFDELSKEPVFVKEFTDMITGFGEDVKSMFQPTDNDKTIKNSIIPYIELYKSYSYYKDDATTEVFSVENNFSVFSVNLDKIQDDKYDSEYFYNRFVNTTIGNVDIGRHELPVVVCVQNGFINIGKSAFKATNFEKGFLKGLYIPVAYSYAYNGKQSIDYKTYNIIYVRKECIDNEANRADDFIAVDQTDYFTLRDIPEGTGITLETFNKSFSAVNFNFSNDRSSIRGTEPYDYINYETVGLDSADLESERRRKMTTETKEKKESKNKLDAIEIKINAMNVATTKLPEIISVKSELDKLNGNGNISAGDKTRIADLLAKLQNIENDVKAKEAKDKADALALVAKAKLQKEMDDIIKESNAILTDSKKFETEIKNINDADVTKSDDKIKLAKFKTNAVQKLKDISDLDSKIKSLSITEANIIIAKADILNMKTFKGELETMKTNANKLKTTGAPPHDPLISELAKIKADALELETKSKEDLDKFNAIKDKDPIEFKKIKDDAEKANTEVKSLNTKIKLYKVKDILDAKKNLEEMKIQRKIVGDKLVESKALPDIPKEYIPQKDLMDIYDKITIADEKKYFTQEIYDKIKNIDLTIEKHLIDNKLAELKNEISNNFDKNYKPYSKYLTYITSFMHYYKLLLKLEDKEKVKDNYNQIKDFEIINNLKLNNDCLKNNDFFSKCYIKQLENIKILEELKTKDVKIDEIEKEIKKLHDNQSIVDRKLNEEDKTKIKANEEFKKVIEVLKTDDENDVGDIDDKKEELLKELNSLVDNKLKDDKNNLAIIKEIIKYLIPNIETLENSNAYYESINTILIGGAITPRNAFTIATTELVGSRIEDLLHIDEIVKFELRKKQIDKIKKLLVQYNGKEPDILCGEFGGTIQDLTSPTKTDELYNLYTSKINKIRDDPNKSNPANKTKLVELLKKFYDHGMSDFASYTPYPEKTPTEPEYTNSDTKLVSNYIFYKSTSLNAALPINNFNDPEEDLSGIKNFLRLIDIYGGTLPVVVNFQNIIASAIKVDNVMQEKGRTYVNVKLYNEKEIYNIIRMIDKLMSQFTYGYKAYLKRDLGCFSFDSKDTNPYSIRVKPKENEYTDANSTNKLTDFYTMNYPAYMDVFLYQISGFYNNPGKNPESYYSENQISRTGVKHTATNVINFLQSKDIKDQTPFIKDTVIRMLLIPSIELKMISSSADITTRNSKKERVFDIISAKDYMKLAQEFSTNFYRKRVIPKLEARLKNLVSKSTSANPTAISSKKDNRYTNKAQDDVESATLNRGLLYELLKTGEGEIETVVGKDSEGKDQIETKTVPKLTNIGNPELIESLFEFIFIMLKLKFLDKQVEDIEKAQMAVESSIVKSEKFAVFGEKYKEYVKILFDLWGKMSIAGLSDVLKTKFMTEIKKNFVDELKIFKESSTGKYVINDDKEVKKPADIKTVLELKNVEAYVAYVLMILIINDLKLSENNLENIINDHNNYINKLETSLTTIVKGDEIAGETVKSSIKLLIAYYKKVYNNWYKTHQPKPKTKAGVVVPPGGLGGIPLPPGTPGGTPLPPPPTTDPDLLQFYNSINKTIEIITNANNELTISLLLNTTSPLTNINSSLGLINSQILKVTAEIHTNNTNLSNINSKIASIPPLPNIASYQDYKTNYFDKYVIDLPLLNNKLKAEETRLKGLTTAPPPPTPIDADEQKIIDAIKEITAGVAKAQTALEKAIEAKNNTTITDKTLESVEAKKAYDEAVKLNKDDVNTTKLLINTAIPTLTDPFLNDKLTRYRGYEKELNDLNLDNLIKELLNITVELETTIPPKPTAPAPAGFEDINNLVTDHKDAEELKDLFNNITAIPTNQINTEVNIEKLRELFNYGITSNSDDANKDIQDKYKKLNRILFLKENELLCGATPSKIICGDKLTELFIPVKSKAGGGIIKNYNTNINKKTKRISNSRNISKTKKKSKIVQLGGADPPPPGVMIGVKTLKLTHLTINGLIKHEKDNNPPEDSNLYVLNFASIEKPGGQVENGYMGEEEELCRTSPEFYKSFSLYHTKNSDSIKNSTIITKEVAFVRHDGCDTDKPYELFEESKKDTYKATVISIFTPNISEAKIGFTDTGTDISGLTDPSKTDINKFFTEFVGNLVTLLTQNPDNTKLKKTLIIGTGIFGEHFAPKDEENRKKYIDYIITKLLEALCNKDGDTIKDNCVYDKILFAIPKKKITSGIIDKFINKFTEKLNDLKDNKFNVYNDEIEIT